MLIIIHILLAEKPDSPKNITLEVIKLNDTNLTISVSWINDFAGKVSRYIVYVSRFDQPTTYDGTVFPNNPNYRTVSFFQSNIVDVSVVIIVLL